MHKLVTSCPKVSIVIPTHNRISKLIRLIHSIENNSFKNVEVIVVDDASTDGTYETIKELFPEIKIIRTEKNCLVSGCRNIGMKQSVGEYIFVLDDDNILDKECVANLVKVFEGHPNFCVLAPLMYYYDDPKVIWCAGIKRNMATSRTFTIGNRQKDRNQFSKLMESDDFPNAFIFRKEASKDKNIFFDERNFPFMYEESDFISRLKDSEKKAVLVPDAKIWHDVSKDPFFLGRYNTLKAYYLARNRVLFHKKYSSKKDYVIFRSAFLPFFSFVYITLIFQHWIIQGEWLTSLKVSNSYIKGVISGLALARNIKK
jgi:GT2 family glycosyltransferase